MEFIHFYKVRLMRKLEKIQLDKNVQVLKKDATLNVKGGEKESKDDITLDYWDWS